MIREAGTEERIAQTEWLTSAALRGSHDPGQGILGGPNMVTEGNRGVRLASLLRNLLRTKYITSGNR